MFQGRYKSVPVNCSDADRYYFRIVADYIHLNPARTGLAGELALEQSGGLRKRKEPPWLEMERVLRSFELAEDGRGRRAEAGAASGGGGIGGPAKGGGLAMRFLMKLRVGIA